MASLWKIITKNICFAIFINLFQSIAFSQEGPDSTFIIRQYGFADYGEYEEIRDSIGKIWNIEYWLVGNCTVSENFRDSIKKMNDQTEKNLDKKYGVDWEKRFFAEVDTIFNKLEYDRENLIMIKDTIENENFYIEYTRNYYGSKKWFTIYSKKGLSSSEFSICNEKKLPINYLFRGMENNLYIKFPFRSDSTNYYLGYKNVFVTSINFLDSIGLLDIKVRPSISKEIILEIKNNFDIDTTIVFKVVNIPMPLLQLNNYKKEKSVSLSLISPDPFKGYFSYEILSWDITSSIEKRIYGKGNAFTKEAEEYIKSLKKGSKISFTCQVHINQEQGVTRKVSGEFIIQ